MALSPWRRAVALAALAALPAAQAPADPVPVRIEAGVIFADVRINGQGPFRCIVDTGATECLITPATARRLGIAPAHATVRSPRVTLDSLALGEGEVERLRVHMRDPLQAVTLRLDRGIDYAGLIGYPFLSRFDVTIDYAARTLAVRPPGSRAREAEARAPLARVPFVLRNRLILTDAYVNERGPLRTIIDSGSAEVLIHPRVARPLGLRATYGPRQDGAGFARLESLRVGPLARTNLQAVVYALLEDRGPAPSYDALLGTPFLSHYTVTFDYRNTTLWFDSPGR